MAKQYMVGTVDDAPLLMVTLGGVQYFLDEATNEAYEDKPGLPRISDEKKVKQIIEASIPNA